MGSSRGAPTGASASARNFVAVSVDDAVITRSGNAHGHQSAARTISRQPAARAECDHSATRAAAADPRQPSSRSDFADRDRRSVNAAGFVGSSGPFGTGGFAARRQFTSFAAARPDARYLGAAGCFIDFA